MGRPQQFFKDLPTSAIDQILSALLDKSTTIIGEFGLQAPTCALTLFENAAKRSSVIKAILRTTLIDSVNYIINKTHFAARGR